MAFSDRTIEEIKSRLSIVDVVSSYTQVLQRNNGFWIRCPFHGNGNERTPSCKLNMERGSYYCFACHEHGSMFDFVMKMDKVTFPESVRMLAQKAGVAIEDEARLYLARRKITDETIRRFDLGYAPRDPKWLHTHLTKLGYSDDFLRQSGFFSRNSYPYPLFCNRLMFPVKSWQGRVVAFGARDLTFRDDTPKYINTPETAVYSKKHNLYGFFESLDTVKKDHEVIVCEGNFDAISLHQAGLTCAVAPFGTAFTSEQAGLIARYASVVKLLFDTDQAGQDATVKAVTMLQEKGLETRILSLDRYKDASEYLEKEGPQALKSTLEVSSDAFTYLVKRGLDLYNTRTPKGKSEFVQSMAPFLNATVSNVERDAYVRQISQILGVGEVEIGRDLAGALSSSRQVVRQQNVDQDSSSIHFRRLKVGDISPDLYMMLMFANHRGLFATYTRAFRFGDLKDREAQMIYLALESVRRDGVGRTDELFLSLIADDQVRHDVATSFLLPEFKVDNPEEVIDEILDRITLRKLEERRRLVLLQIRQGEAEGFTEAEQKELLNEKIDLDSQIRGLSERLQNI